MNANDIVAGPDVTDAAGTEADARQVARMNARYLWASSRIRGGLVAEIACGTGQGLGLLAAQANSVIGIDYSTENLAVAHRTYGTRVAFTQCEAGALPFSSQSLDAIVALEALYFFPSERNFFTEAQRCLRPGGRLLVSVINCDTADYNPRGIYRNHYGVRELVAACERCGFEATVFGSIPLRFSLRERLFRPLKHLAVKLDLVPNTNTARARLKRIVFGKLQNLPYEIALPTARFVSPPVLHARVPNTTYQVILCEGVRRH